MMETENKNSLDNRKWLLLSSYQIFISKLMIVNEMIISNPTMSFS